MHYRDRSKDSGTTSINPLDQCEKMDENGWNFILISYNQPVFFSAIFDALFRPVLAHQTPPTHRYRLGAWAS